MRQTTGDFLDRVWNFFQKIDQWFSGGKGGCKQCGCLEAGSLDNHATCNLVDGSCLCKQNVEGRHCDQCRQGHFKVNAMISSQHIFLGRCQETTPGAAPPVSATAIPTSASRLPAWCRPASPATSHVVQRTGWLRSRAGRPRPATMLTR